MVGNMSVKQSLERGHVGDHSAAGWRSLDGSNSGRIRAMRIKMNSLRSHIERIEFSEESRDAEA